MRSSREPFLLLYRRLHGARRDPTTTHQHPSKQKKGWRRTHSSPNMKLNKPVKIVDTLHAAFQVEGWYEVILMHILVDVSKRPEGVKSLMSGGLKLRERASVGHGGRA